MANLLECQQKSIFWRARLGTNAGIYICRDFVAKCEQVSASIRKEGSGATGKRDLARLSHWFEAFSERAGAYMHCRTSGALVTVA